MAADAQRHDSGSGASQRHPLMLQLLGALHISCGDATLQTDTKKAIALLAYLAMEPGAHERDALASLLWTSNDPARNKAALRRTLSTTQKALDRIHAPRLEVTRKTIAAPDAMLSVDALQLQTLLDHPPEAAPPQDAVEAAIALYQGPFLAGFSLQESTAFETWCRTQTQALQTTYLQALRWSMERCEAEKQWAEAITLARQWLLLDPLDESIHQALIRWHIQAGQRDAALHQYETCSRELSEGLGTKPAAATRQLLSQLQGAAPANPPSEARPLALSEATDTPHLNAPAMDQPGRPGALVPLLGRDKEKAEVLALLRDPMCLWLTIKGPFGAGKSHLAHHVVQALAPDVVHLDASTSTTPAALAEALDQMLAAQAPQPKAQWLLVDQVRATGSWGEALQESLQRWPAQRLLVTARAQANVRGEWVYELDELAHNAQDTAWRESPAAQLFAWYARKQQHAFALAEQGAFGRLYGRLGGHPLALEMAAAWCHVLPLDALEESLAADLSMLERVDAAGQTLRLEAMFRAAWEALDAAVQGVCQAMAQSSQTWFSTSEWLALPGASLPHLLALRDGAWLRRDEEGRLALWSLLHTCLLQWC